MEFRKHYSDFTKAELKLLEELVKRNTYEITHHTIIRKNQKRITVEEIYRAIEDGKIIEYHCKDSNRVLIRGNKSEGKYNVCVVLDVDNGNIVTAFDNLIEDRHYTLDKTKYISYINIVGLLKEINTYK